MRVLILHMRFHPDPTGTAPLVTDLAVDLAAMGDEVTVVASMPHYGRKEIPPEYRGRLLQRSDFKGVDLWRTFVYVPPNPSGFHRGINYLSYTFMSIVAGLRAPRPDVILCVNPPITVGLSGWFVRVARRVPIVLNIQDVWPDCLVIIGQLRNPLLIRTFQVLERMLYRASRRVTVLSEGMQRNLLAKGVAPGKVTVIPNWANVDLVQPVAKDSGFRAMHGLNGRFVVLFAGNLGYISMLDTVLDAARELRDNPRVVLLIVGEGNAKAALVRRAEEMRLANVRFLTTQPAEELPRMLGAADLSLVTLNRHLGQLNVPSKTYHIMASGRPVLAAVPEDSEIARLVREADCGVLVPPEDPMALAEAIKDLAARPGLLEQYGANGRRHVVRHYDRHALTRRYHDLLEEVAQSGGHSRWRR